MRLPFLSLLPRPVTMPESRWMEEQPSARPAFFGTRWTMAILIQCACGKQLQAREEQAGQRVRCPSCGAVLDVPAAATAVQPPAAITAPSPLALPPPQTPLGRREDG